MAVVVKNKREILAGGLLNRLPVQVTLGVLYVLASAVIVFPLFDYVWWWWLHLDRTSILAWLGRDGLGLALALGLTFLGLKLLGPKPLKGLKAGIFLGVAGIGVLALFLDWVGFWIQGWLLPSTWVASTCLWAGAGITLALGVALIALGVKYLYSEPADKWLTVVAEQGWFSTAPYKRNQGVRVRRGTILGILILAGCGIWTLSQHLDRMGGDLQVPVPFTGTMQITEDSIGDNPVLQAQLAGEQYKLTAAWVEKRDAALKTVEDLKGEYPDVVREELQDLAGPDNPRITKLLDSLPPPAATGGPTAGTSGAEPPKPEGTAPAAPAPEDEAKRAEARQKQEQDKQQLAAASVVLHQPQPGAVLGVNQFDIRDQNRAFAGDPANNIPPSWVKIVNPGDDPYADPKAIVARLERALETIERVGPLFPAMTRAKLKDVGTSHPDLAAADPKVKEVLAQIDTVVKGLPTTPPEGAPPLSDWRDLLIALRWIDTPQSFAAGEVVTRAEFDQQRLEREQKEKEFRDKNEPTKADLVRPAEFEAVIPATGPVASQNVVLLPAVKFTLPLLLAALALWFAWRIVNVPVFGDFLIATEAELNKVSWTSRQRLYHDTVVVLVTVLILAVFLFAADFVWSKVLTGIGVLQPPPAETQTNQQQPW